jgi:Two component regulator propeller
MKLRFSIGLTLLIFLLQKGIAQEYYEKLFTVKDGLPSNRVNGVFQDHSGFIWISTNNSLACFDGYAFKTFHHDANDSSSLSDNSKVDTQQMEIENLKSEMNSIKSQSIKPQSQMNDGFTELKTLNSQPETILGQNIPNPFDNSTLIPFRIPKDCHDASIMITNISSAEVVIVLPISCNEDHVQIDAGTLSSGSYSYSLFVDGKMIDTKQMIIQK